MKQHATSVSGEGLWKLAYQRLCLAAELAGKHHDEIAGGVRDDLACGVDLLRLDAGLLRRERVIRFVEKREGDRVFRSRPDVQKRSSLFDETDAYGIRDDQLRAAVSHCLPHLFARQR